MRSLYARRAHLVLGTLVALLILPAPPTHADHEQGPELLVASAAAAVPTDQLLTSGALADAGSRAVAEWIEAWAPREMPAVAFEVADLPGLELGHASGSTVVIDRDAGGHGWSVVTGDAAAGMDLMTAVRHEVGHVLGLEHGSSALMASTLSPGEARHVPVIPDPEPEPAVEPAPAVEPVAADLETVEQEAAAPAAVEPGPVEPAAVEPAPVEPAAAEPAPVDPAAVEPGTDPAATRTDTTTTDPAATDPAASDSPATAVSATGATGSGTADGESPDAGASTTTATVTTTPAETTTPTETTTATETPTPAESPTAAWTLSGGTATLDLSAGGPTDGTLRYDTDRGVVELVAADGRVESLPVAGVQSIVVTGTAGDDRVTLDLAGLPAGVAVTVDGAGGNDTLTGPSATTTWHVTGVDAGTVGGAGFAGVEHLQGAADHDDTFVLTASGTLTGSVDGGAGGFDSLVVNGTHTSSTYLATGPDSGFVTLDGRTLAYRGLEPVTVTDASATMVLTATGGDDHLVLELGGAGLVLRSTTGTIESHDFAVPSGSLRIDLGAGNDSLAVGNLGSLSLAITVEGGAGTDELVAPDLASTWKVTGVDAGSYRAAGFGLDFVAMESLVGALTAADTVDVADRAGLTGSLDDRAGTLTFSVAGFVKVSGDYTVTTATRMVDYRLGGSTATVSATVLTVGATAGTGFVGVSVLDNPVGLTGAVEEFGLAVVAAGTQAWHLATATFTDPTISGLDLTIGLDAIGVSVSTAAADGSYLLLGGTPIAVDTGDGSPVQLAFTNTVLSASARALITIESVVHVGGTFTFALGGEERVDVATGLLPGLGGAAPLPGLDGIVVSALPGGPADGSLARSADYSMIYNVPVRALQIAASGVNVFAGNNFSWTDTNLDAIIQEAELADTTTGFLAGGISYGLILFTALSTGVGALDAQRLRFMALSATASSIGLVNVEGFRASMREVAVEVNTGRPWTGAAATPVVDWATSFPDTADAGSEPDGYRVITGGAPVTIAYGGDKLIGFSAGKAILQVSDSVHVSGSFSVRFGQTARVDIATGFTAMPTGTLAAVGTTLATISTTPSETALWREENFSVIHNVQVNTIELGASGVSVFFGWAPGLSAWDLDTDPNADGVLSRAELDAVTGDDAIGFFVENLRLGMLMANPLLTGPQAAVASILPKTFALSSYADSASWIGFEDLFEITARGVGLEVSSGTGWAGAPVGTPSPVVDWKASFPDGDTGGPDLAGYEVRTGGASSSPVLLDLEGTPLVGISADRSLLQISDAVLITGAFSVRVGPVAYVDVVTGLSSVPASLTALAAAIPVSSVADVSTDGDSWQEDPGNNQLARSADFGIIYNLPVNTLQLGLSGASAFFGWAPGLSGFSLATDDDGMLDRAELDSLTGDDPATTANEADRNGMFISGLRLGLVSMSPVGTAVPAPLLHLLPKLFALSSFAADAGWVGLEDHFELTARNLAVEVNQGTAWTGVLPGTPAPTVDWKRSFGGSGFSVRTGTTAAAPAVVIDLAGTPLIGVSADRTLLQISDAVLVTGGFSIRVGAVRHVDVVTGLTAAPTGPLGVALAKIAVSTAADADDDGWQDDPGGTTLARSGDYGIIYNVPVTTLELGVTDASVFLGWAPGLSGFSLTTDDDGLLDRDELDTLSAGDRNGLFVSGMRLGLLLMNPVPLTGLQTGVDKLMPRLFALDSFAADAGWVGLEEYFELTARNVAVQVNQGTAWAGVLPGTPNPTVDWKRSFGDAGYQVRTGTTEDSAPVTLDFAGTPLIGVSADRTLLQILDVVHVSGGFSIRVGPVELVDVVTGLTGAPTNPALLAALSKIPTLAQLQATGGNQNTDLWRAGDYTVLHNVPVNSFQLGVTDASVFLGWAPGLAGWSLQTDTDGVLSRAELDALTGDDPATAENEADRTGVFVSGLRLGMMVMNPVPLGGLLTGVDKLLPRLFALTSFATDAGWVGFEDVFELTLRNVAVEVNQGTAWAGVAPGTPNPVVDWKGSFPDSDGTGTDDKAGFEVRTGTTEDSEAMLLDLAGTPLVGFSADRSLLQILDVVHVSGGFSVRIGPVERVDVATGFTGAPTSNPALLTALDRIPTAATLVGDPATALWRSDDYRTLHNVPVNTFQLGVTGASVFLGWAPGLSGWNLATDEDGVLSRAEFDALTGDDPATSGREQDPVGLFVSDLSLGMMMMDPVPLLGAQLGIDTLLPRLFALKTFAVQAGWVGFEDVFELTFRNVAVEVNQGTAWAGLAPNAPRPVVDWTQSYGSAGFAVRTGTTSASAPVMLDLEGTPLIGVSADRSLLQISDAVHISGAFSFRLGAVRLVDVVTGFSGLTPPASLAALALIPVRGAVADPDVDLWRADDFSVLHNVPVNTIEFGVTGLSVFLGWAPGLASWSLETDDDGVLSRAELDLPAGDPVGFFLENLQLGMVIMNPVPLLGPLAPVTAFLPKLFALDSFADSMSVLGLEEFLELTARSVAVEINQGTAWAGVLPGTPNPAVDWKASFPDSDGAGTDLAGYEVRTGSTSASKPMLLEFDGTPLIGISADKVLLQISDFVHVSGSFSFRVGPVLTVDVATGLTPSSGVLTPLSGLLGDRVTDTDNGEVGRSTDYGTLWNIPVNTLQLGVSGASVFVGYAPGLSAWNLEADTDGVLTRAELDALTGDDAATVGYDGDAVGFFVGDLTLGMMIMNPVPFNDATLLFLNNTLPRLFTLKGEAADIDLIGIPGITFDGDGVRVEVNMGTRWASAPPTAGQPGVDYLSSFPADAGEEGTEDDVPAGYAIATGTTTEPVRFTFETFLIGGGVEKVTIGISEFVFITGAVYFEYGVTRTVPLTSGVIDTSALAELGLPPEVSDYLGLPGPGGPAEKELRFLTIGGHDLHAFVGLNGPYWTDANGNGIIDRYPVGHARAGQIVDAEVDGDATGLVLDGVSFGLALMTPTEVLDPIRYLALRATATKVALVGIEGLTANAENVFIELNISTPTLYGIPVLPVVDFGSIACASCTGGFGLQIKTGARDDDGNDIYEQFSFSTPLIRARAQLMELDVLGVVVLRGSIAFVLGPTEDITTVSGAQVSGVTTMTIGGSNIYGFLGVNGPHWQDGAIGAPDGQITLGGDGMPVAADRDPDAVGLAITDLDFGILVGVATNVLDGVGAFLAGSISVGGFGFVGLAAMTMLGTLGIRFNVGAGSFGLTGIDFLESFTYDHDGDDTTPEIPGYALDTGDPNNPVILDYDSTFIQAELAGSMRLDDVMALVGVFVFSVDEQGLKVLASGRLVVGPDLTAYNASGDGGAGAITNPLLEISALGAIVINASGLAADLDVDLGVGVPGLRLDVSARFLLNTTGQDQEIEVPQRLLDFLNTIANAPGAGADSVLAQALLDRLTTCADGQGRCYVIDGSAPDITNFTTVYNLLHNPAGPITRLAAGAYVVAVVEGTFEFVGLASGYGLMGIGINAGPRFQLVFDVDFAIGTSGIELKFASTGILDLSPAGVLVDVSVTLDIDITSMFHVDVAGRLKIDTRGADDYFRLDLSGRLDIAGIISVSGGLIVEVNGGAWRIEVPDNDRLTGDFGPLTIQAWGFIASDGQFSLNFSASIDLGIDGFGIRGTVAAGVSLTKEASSYRFRAYVEGSVSLRAFGVNVASFSVNVNVDGLLGAYVVLNVEVCVDLFFDEACADFDVARIQLPASIFPEPPPRLAQFASGDGGTLLLNVGTRAGNRNVSPAATAEDYTITQLGYDASTGRYTVRVNAFGKGEVFDNVTDIVGDLGSDHDRVVVRPGAGLPVNLTGGDGNDLLSYLGTGAATLLGGIGNDTLTGGSGVDSLDGGAGNDYLDGRGGVDTMVGGPGDDVFFGIVANLVGETIADTDGSDTVEIVGTEGNDTITVSAATVLGRPGLAIGYSGSAGSGTVLVTSAETFLLNPGSGSDTVTVTGALQASGLTRLVIALGDGSTDAPDSVVMSLGESDDTLTLSGEQAAAVLTNARGDGVVSVSFGGGAGGTSPVPTTTATWAGQYALVISNSGAAHADLLTIRTLGGADTVLVPSLVTNAAVEAGDGADRVAVGPNAAATTNAGGRLEAIDAALAVTGGAGSDTLTVDDSGESGNATDGVLTSARITGLGLASTGISYAGVESLAITLGSGSDAFSVRSTAGGTGTVLDAGAGNDTVTVSNDAVPANGTLDDVAGALTVTAGTGADTLFASDAGDPNGDTGTLTATTLTGLSPAVITYLLLESLDVDLGSGADALTVVTTHAGSTRVDAGASGDTVLVQAVPAGASLLVNGDAGDDVVDVVTLAGTGTVNGGDGLDDVVVRGLTGTLAVNGGAGADWVGLLANAAGSALTVHGDAGDDVVEVGSLAATGERRTIGSGGTVDAVDGTVTVHGDEPSASDWLHVDDTGDDAAGSGETGVLTATTVTGLGMTAGITYATVEHLLIGLGDDATAFRVRSTDAGTDTVLATGGGDDTVDVSSDAPANLGTVDAVAGHLTVDGQGGTDTMTVSDRGDTGANTGELTSTDLTGLGMGAQGITYAGLEVLNIDLGQGSDTFTVRSTHAGLTTLDGNGGADAVAVRTIAGHTVVDTGAGTDTVTVGSLAPAAGGTLDGIAALLEVTGQDGRDTLTVDDRADTGANAGTVTGTTIEGLGTGIGSAHAATPSSAVHVVTVTAALDGTFTLTLGGATTVELDFDASAEAVRAALGAALGTLPAGWGAADLDVTRTLVGDRLVLTIALVGDLVGLTGRELGVLTATGALLGDGTTTPTVVTSTMTDGRIVYLRFEVLAITLGQAADVVHVRSTHAGSTTLDGGPGDDVLLVETIAGRTTLLGGAGDDALVVNPLPAAPSTANGLAALLSLDGQAGSDEYTVNAFGTGTSRVDVHDGGGTDDTGHDRLTVNGTAAADTLLLRAGLVAALSGKVAGAFTTAELVTYDVTIDSGLTVNGLGGDDVVALDDNSTVTTINGGSGADTFQVGQMFGPGAALSAEFGTQLLPTTRGDLSNGISFSTTINGGDGPDRFAVFHNKAVLQLNGDGGDDEFVIRTFLEADETTRISSGVGRDLIRYVMNAPVSIDGGDGFDTVVIIGTEADDDFVVTATGVYGAGRYVAFLGVERVDVDGAEGDDRFFVQSTAAGVQVRIFGGLGSDTVTVAGDAPAVFADDLLGHTGLVGHSVESSCAAGTTGCTAGSWVSTVVDGIAAEIADNDEATVVVTESGGRTVVREGPGVGAGTTDTVTVVLARAPTADVVVNFSAPSRSPEAMRDRSFSVQVSLDGLIWGDAVTLRFTSTTWNVARTVHVRAVHDLSAEGERFAPLQALVTSADPTYHGLAVLTVMAQVLDDDAAGVVVVESGVDTVVRESGTTDSYEVSLAGRPLAAVTVTIRGSAQVCVSSAGDANADCGDLTLTFTTTNWSVPQTVTVRAAADTAVEGPHVGHIDSTVTGGGTVTGTVISVSGTRITVLSTSQLDAGALRGYELRLVGGSAGGQTWSVWTNLASTPTTGGWITVITVQGAIDVAPATGDTVVVSGYLPPAVTGVLEGTVTAVSGRTLTVIGLPVVADGALAGAIIRVFVGGSTQFRTIATNVGNVLTLDSEWAIAVGTAFSILDVPGTTVDTLPVLVADDDAPGVLITQTDGSTRVTEGGAHDTYSVVLTRAPVAGETVTVVVTPQLTENWHKPFGQAGYTNAVQVCVSTSSATPGAGCGGVVLRLTFTSETWNVAQTVYVHAINDTVVDGSDLQSFADSTQRLHLIQGPLVVDGFIDEGADRTIPPPVLLPGETSPALVTPSDPAFDVDESRQVDTLVVHNEDSVSDDTGNLTGTRLTGLGLGPDQLAGGRFLPGGISYEALEALTLHLGSGADTLTVHSTHLGTTTVTGGAGNDTVVVRTIDGHTNLAGGAGNDTFRVGSTAPATGGVLDELDALLVLDGGTGQDAGVVDDSGDTDDNLGTLTQTTLTGLDMTAGAVDRVYSLTIGATTTHVTFTVVHSGRTLTLTLPVAGLTAASLQAALQALLFPVTASTPAQKYPVTGCGLVAGADGVLNSRCAQSVLVWAHDGDYLIGFRGELAGVAVGLSVVAAQGTPAGTATDVLRVDGINYYGFTPTERLHVLLGSGDDRFNVRGTLPWTTLETAAGDDLVYVSDTADLGRFDEAAAAADRDLETANDRLLHGTVTVDDLVLTGSLDRVAGRLDVNSGSGSNSLAVSDRDDPDADTAVTVTSGSVAGLAPALITYSAAGGDLAGQGRWTQVADLGLFGRGITLYAGQGADVIAVTSVLGGAVAASPFTATVTTVRAGGGSDRITAAVAGTAGAVLVLHGNDGDDTLDAGGSAHPVTVFGDSGADTITGGSGNDHLVGDDGRVHFLAPAAPWFDVVLGGSPAGSLLPTVRDAAFATPDLLLTRDAAIGAGDTITGGAGNDIVLGGRGSDTVHAGTGNDLVLGDLGRVFAAVAGGWVDAGQLPLSIPGAHPFAWDSTDSTDDVNAAGDVLNGDAGADILLGQQGADRITGGDGDDDITGGHDVAGGHDTGDWIDAGAGHDVVLGDNGVILRTGSTRTLLVRALAGTTLDGPVTADAQLDPAGVEARTVTVLDHAVGTAANLWGADVVAGGAGNDLVLGQLGDDRLHGDGRLVGNALATDVDTTRDGDDYLEGNGGSDTLWGGLGQDDVIGGSSDLFGLVDRAQRPDGSDTVHGGNGDAAARNDLGTSGTAAHARDADVLLGDNGRILRVVGTNGIATTSFLIFTYDSYGALRIVPRHVDLLDYSPVGDAAYWFVPGSTSPSAPQWTAGTGTNIGDADVLHGESGDDVLHGMTGNDALFGDAQDDDLYGESGSDWISGGTGDDGIVGDDGRIQTSRNGSTETLHGLTTPNAFRHLATPGGLQTADIYVAGQLHKAVQLDLPVPGHSFSTFYVGANDVAYGGWGNDVVHGGEGDDALSGAEALAVFYTADPWATLRSLGFAVDDVRGVLQWGVERAGEFTAYDEFDPLRKIAGWLLNNDASENATGGEGDGRDVLFGDGGHDWAVGGTGQDRLFGGWGDDLLDVDDDRDTNGGLNDAPDIRTAAPSYADIAYGGAGRDILIANTGADRLIDWVGEFNSYLVPFSPYGAFTISRSVAPALQQYLLDLAAGLGADITRGGDASRNGEPYGELGMVLQKDAEWRDQTGAPADPQAGNLQGPRDVLRAESFTSAATALAAFAVDSGTWSVQNGRYESKAVPGADAVSLFYVDALIPPYVEIVATVNADKAKGGFKSNAYVVLDYQSATDFMFAGIEIGTSKAQIGHRTAAGWVVLAQANWTLVANRDYVLVVAVDGRTITLYVDGVAALTYTVPVSADGSASPLADGMIGIGSNGSIMRLEQISVRTLAPQITFASTDELDAPSGYDIVSGAWGASGGTYVATPGASDAIALTAIEVAAGAMLGADTALTTTGVAGIVYDYTSPTRFKLAVLDVPGGRVVLGHRTSGGWFVDSVVAARLSADGRHVLAVTLEGTTVTVLLDGLEVLSRSYASLLTDGQLGLLARFATASFDTFSLRTDDPDLTPPLPLVSVQDLSVAEGAGSSTVEVTLTLSRASDQPVTVTVSTSDLSALAGSDYAASSVTVTFAPGQTLATVTMTVLGDAVQEADETFVVVLSAPAGAILGDASAVVTIRNDDVPSTITVSAPDTTATEGGDTATFVVTRTGDQAASLTVVLQWSGTGVLGVDHRLSAVGGTLSADGTRLTLTAGSAQATLTLTALTDTAAEAPESVTLTAVPDAAYGLGPTAAATVTITDAGALPVVSVLDVSVIEGLRDGWVTVTLQLSQASSVSVTVEVRTYDGTAAAGSDYKPVSTTVTFAPGQTTVTVSVRILGDNRREGDETFTVELARPAGAAVGDGVGVVTIVDDDGGALLAERPATGAPTGDTDVAEDELAPLVEAALAEWAAAGADPALLAALTFSVADLDGSALGVTAGTSIVLDVDGAGFGWYLDATPTDDTELRSCGGSPSVSTVCSQMDLYTVLLHEIGHALGHDHDAKGPLRALMSGTLAEGTRRHVGAR